MVAEYNGNTKVKKTLLAGITALFLATGTAHAETMEQYCKGHWTDPRKDYAECVRIRRMEDANEFINRAEDACEPLLKRSGKADATYMRCLESYQDDPVEDIGKKVPNASTHP
jgi:hypothetical protein